MKIAGQSVFPDRTAVFSVIFEFGQGRGGEKEEDLIKNHPRHIKRQRHALNGNRLFYLKQPALFKFLSLHLASAAQRTETTAHAAAKLALIIAFIHR